MQKCNSEEGTPEESKIKSKNPDAGSEKIHTIHRRKEKINMKRYKSSEKS